MAGMVPVNVKPVEESLVKTSSIKPKARQEVFNDILAEL